MRTLRMRRNIRGPGRGRNRRRCREKEERKK
jgi:hypothetical protein